MLSKNSIMRRLMSMRIALLKFKCRNVDTSTLNIMLCCLMNNEKYHFIPAPAIPSRLATKIVLFVNAAANSTKASVQSVLQYLSGDIDEIKLMHLMHCSCNCRQCQRDAFRGWIASNDDDFIAPTHVRCMCCKRHQRGVGKTRYVNGIHK